MMANLTVRDIVERWLKEHGYDGLHHKCDCGCEVGDLMPCDSEVMYCTAGYKCPGDEEYDFFISECREIVDA